MRKINYMALANELRLGNWVHVTGKDFQITDFEVMEYASRNGTPIPLTPEILEKCGFKKYSHEPGYTMGDDFEKSEKCDEYSLGKLSIMDWGNGFILSNSFSFDLRVELKHLHQLQNLYFALTGSELEINL